MPRLNNPLLNKSVPLPPGFLSPSPRTVAPIQSKKDEYAWVFHPDYGFYFLEGFEANHYRFFYGSNGSGNSRTEVMPNKLYDDCNRGYAWVDRKKKQVQIQVAPIIEKYHRELDFVPRQVVAGFQKAFPKFNVFVKGSHMASLAPKVALDAFLEMLNDEDYATHQHHSDPDFTTQNGKMMGKGTEVEEGNLSDAIPGRLLASRGINRATGKPLPPSNLDINDVLDKTASVKSCVACECGDCTTHIGGGTVNDLTNTVVPGAIEEPAVQDATFFKESDEEFEVSRTADVKSYGAGTPNGGTPSTPKPTSAQPEPPPPPTPNPVPPVQTVNKTPQQLHDQAQNNPSETGNLTQQQLQQVLEALKSSSKNETEKFAEMIREAAVPIKESPTSLPPRDDMRRHIDEQAQNEVMEGVNEPAPAQPAAPQQAAPQQPQAQPAPSAQQELLKQTLASEDGRKLAYTWEDEDDDEDNGQLGTVYGKPLGKSESVEDRLEYLRGKLRAENISYGELNELQSLADHIEPDDVELREAAGLPEFEESTDDTMYCPGCQEPGTDVNGWIQFRHTPACKFKGQVWDDSKSTWRQDMAPLKPKPKPRFRPTKDDMDFLKSLRIKAKKAMQTEEGVNKVCPACHGQSVKNLEDSDQENGALVECLTCGCFFAQ